MIWSLVTSMTRCSKGHNIPVLRGIGILRHLVLQGEIMTERTAIRTSTWAGNYAGAGYYNEYDDLMMPVCWFSYRPMREEESLRPELRVLDQMREERED